MDLHFTGIPKMAIYSVTFVESTVYCMIIKTVSNLTLCQLNVNNLIPAKDKGCHTSYRSVGGRKAAHLLCLGH